MLAFWDASAVAPLCLPEARTGYAHRLLRQYNPLVVWWSTPAEVHGAVARLVREEGISVKRQGAALDRLAALRRSWREIVPADYVCELAEKLLHQYPLRTGDAFQLAAALAWTRERPRRRAFVCFDGRLAGAAEQAGFEVLRAP